MVRHSRGRRALLTVTAIVVVCSLSPGRVVALELSVNDEDGKPLPCRVLIRSEEGGCIIPAGAVELVIGPDRWFMSPGHSKVDVPAGKVLLRVERGLEFVRLKENFHVAGPDTAKSVTLRRWVDLRERGYLCGENHLHVDTVTLAPMLVAEGLDFGTSLTWFNGPDSHRPVPEGKGRVRTLTSAGRTVPTSVYDAELEYAWGAAYIQNLPRPLSIPTNRGRPNLDYVRHAVEAGAMVHYQGGWSREVLVDALLGYVHTVNVCNNNFALHRFQPRRRYSNLLGVESFPVYPNTDQGMMRMNTETYYRLLNCGLRLAAGAGSATGVKEVPPGYNRAYVRTGSSSTLEKFNAAWKAGKNFVTNGPVLFLKTLGGHRPGDTVQLPVDGGTITAEVEVMADQRVSAVEVVVNGEVVASLAVKDSRVVKGTVEIEAKDGSWLAARCTARDELLTEKELAAYSDGDGQEPYRVRPSRLRFAHTSPIYVTVGGRSVAVRHSIEEALQMLARFEAFAHERASPEYRPSIQDAVEQARRKLQARLTKI